MLIAEAERRRLAEHKTMADLAGKYGFSVALWSATKNGKKPLHRTLARAIIREWPDLEGLAGVEGMQYLLRD